MVLSSPDGDGPGRRSLARKLELRALHIRDAGNHFNEQLMMYRLLATDRSCDARGTSRCRSVMDHVLCLTPQGP